MSRLPIRLRLALAFGVAASVLLSLVGAYGYLRLESGLSRDLDLELRQRAQDLIGPVSRPHASLTHLAGTGFVERGESFAEVVTPSGRLLDATPTLQDRPLLTVDEAARAAGATLTVDRDSAPGLDEPARLFATPFTRRGRALVLVVGDTRENGLEALRRVRGELLVGLPLLVLATLLGAYSVAGAALRPVEQMRRRATELTGDDRGLRLPIPPSSDEIARLGATLNSLLARVENTLERERSFVAHASHELRTPLALLRTQLELAVRRPRPASELVATIRSAEVEVRRLERLSEDLLLLAQSADGELAGYPEPVAVADIFAEIEDRFSASSAASGRVMEVGSGTGVVLADRGQLLRALTNLVGNALEHGAGVVRMEARQRSGLIELAVSDEGPGFESDLLNRGMERFVRRRASTGAGLGLAIVQAIAVVHGGAAGVRNLDRGAESWLAVPLVETGASAPPSG